MAVPSKRSLINVNFLDFNPDYIFINHIYSSSFGFPGSSGVGLGTIGQYLDPVTGYVNTTADTANTRAVGWGLMLPASASFHGPWVLAWDGTGTLQLTTGAWTETNTNPGDPGFGTWTRITNGKWSSTGSGAHIELMGGATDFSTPTVAAGCFLQITNSDSSDYVHNVRFYRKADEADLLAGKIARAGFLDQLARLDPSAIRFMNMYGGNKNLNTRFSSRVVPTLNSWSTSLTAAPNYPYAAYTNGATYTIGSAAGMPVSHTHGEQVIVYFPDGGPSKVLSWGGRTITGITNGNPAVVSCVGHGFVTGDIVIHNTQDSPNSGMPNLHLVPKTVTVTDPDHYNFPNAAGAGLGTFGAAQVDAYASLNVGGRGAFPMMFPIFAGYHGVHPMTVAGSNQLSTFKTFHFDKTVNGIYDGSGNPIQGAWVTQRDISFVGINDVPIEIIVKLINELNVYKQSIGINDKTHLWINIPSMGLLSIDPDYTSADHWGIQTLNLILNGGGGYSPLAAGLDVYVEYSNETMFLNEQTQWLRAYSLSRWPASGVSDNVDAHALRATCLARDIKAAFPSATNVKHVMGCSAAQGISPGGTWNNYETCFGSDTVNFPGYQYKHVEAASSSWGTPISNFDACCIAPYLDPYSSSGSFASDSLLFQTNPSAAIANFISSVNTGDSTFYAGIFNQYSSTMPAGVYVLNYEGGHDWATNGGSLTANDTAFLIAVLKSSAWGVEQTAVFDNFCTHSNCRMPANYLWRNSGANAAVDYHWAFASPDTYSGTTEGLALTNNGAWALIAARNLGLPDSVPASGGRGTHLKARLHLH